MQDPKVLLIAAAAIWLANPSRGQCHDWYPATCCSDRDCRQLDEDKGETVAETPRGWELWDGRLVPRNSARLSPNGKFHLCETRTHSIICFYAPPGDS